MASNKLQETLEMPDSPEKLAKLKRIAELSSTLSGKSPEDEYRALQQDADEAVLEKARREEEARQKVLPPPKKSFFRR